MEVSVLRYRTTLNSPRLCHIHIHQMLKKCPWKVIYHHIFEIFIHIRCLAFVEHHIDRLYYILECKTFHFGINYQCFCHDGINNQPKPKIRCLPKESHEQNFSNFIIFFIHSRILIRLFSIALFYEGRNFLITSRSHEMLHKNLASLLFCNLNLLIK